MKLLCKCPAKLNLFLSVGPKDERGWHPLRTLYQAISVFDELEIESSVRDEFSCNVEYLTGDNSLTRAVTEYRKRTSVPQLSLRLQKRIPAQSGLGGGSSNAGVLLRALQRFAPDPLSERSLLEVALAVGADVPFFLVGGRAIGEGYGEILSPLPDRPEQHYVVVKPKVDCPTAQMFSALDGLRYEWIEALPHECLTGESTYNDFERVMPELCRKSIERLLAFEAVSAGLTGSGSAVFGVFPSESVASTVAELMRDMGEQAVWVCRSISREEFPWIVVED